MMRISKEDGTLGLACSDCEQAHLAPDGRLWIAGGHCVFRWNLAQKQRQEVIRNNALDSRSGLTFQAVVAGRRYAVAGRRDGKLYLFDGEGRHLSILPQVSFREVRALALSPDESLLLVGNQQGRVWLIALPSGEVIRELPEAHHREVKGVAFAAGCLAPASLDGRVKLWSPEGELLMTLREGGPILQLATSDQGRDLTLLVEGEIGLRRWRLARLFAELERMGIK